MARPPKKRFVQHRITYKEFGPASSKANSDLETKTVTLTADQLEAMRLADLEGMSHNDASDVMKVSRQTFGRIIEQARQIVSGALVNGKTIKLENDPCVEFIDREIKCIECGNEWILSGSNTEENVSCSSCGSNEIIKRTRCGVHCECSLKINK
ncbi:MAG: hypothetical protein C0602_01105 [Denitrovibrio sp.]|nr:MAG: hypothetical protein C0602_01105 [Denitrovibrio sp.]